MTATGASAGGIASQNARSTQLQHCLNTGDIVTESNTASTFIGGIVGKNFRASGSGLELPSSWVESCLNVGAVTAGGNKAYAGGVSAANDEKNINCYYAEAK